MLRVCKKLSNSVIPYLEFLHLRSSEKPVFLFMWHKFIWWPHLSGSDMWLCVTFVSSACIHSPNGPARGLSLLLMGSDGSAHPLKPVLVLIEMAYSDWPGLRLASLCGLVGNEEGTVFGFTQIAWPPRAPPRSCGGRGN